MSLDPHEEPAAIQTHIGAIFISLELSRSKWLITSLVPGGGQRMSPEWVITWVSGRGVMRLR